MNIKICRSNHIKITVIDYIYLNDDILNIIMLYSNIYVIKKYLQTCKQARKLLDNNHFWIKKFNYDNILIYQYLYHNTYPSKIYWVKEYIKCYKLNHQLANFITIYNNRDINGYHIIIQTKIPYDIDLSWISFNFNEKIKYYNKYHHLFESNIAYLTIEKLGLSAYIVYCVGDDYDNIFNINKSIKSYEYEKYLQKMMYYLSGYKFKLI